MSYWQAQASARFELEIKKSRFIALAWPCTTREQAMEYLEQARAEFPDARHHCWAYVLGDPDNAASMASSDAGEPGGTAGRPMLSVLMHKHIGDLMLVVVRYFGGIKLGAGGLVRAYGQAVDGVVQKLELSKPVTMQQWQARCDFSQEQFLRHWLEQQGGEVLDVSYGEQVKLKLQLPQHASPDDEQLSSRAIVLQQPQQEP